MPDVQREYVDALGRRHRAPRATIAAIDKAARGRAPHRTPTRVVLQGTRPKLGPAEIVLEDGGSLTIDRDLPQDLPLGYHRIQPRRGAEGVLVLAPRACHLPDDYRVWGWAIQLYAARSRRSWGLGDLADLRWLGRWASAQGAGIALINPLAAPAPTTPQQPSPYFPSSRRFRSPLYLRVEEIPGARDVDEVREIAQRARRLNRDRLIDRDRVFELKSKALEAVWARARATEDAGFEAFRREQEGLEEFATYCALAEKFGAGFAAWPAEYRHPSSPAVARARRDRRMRERIVYHQWLQYHVDRQLKRASAAMPVMQDLPIGFDAQGADAWAFQDVLARGISVGAPPDEFNTKGQNWGLPPFVPEKLRDAGYGPFVQTIRACIRHAGGLRIDHVMGLFRLFWIPDGMEARDGAYVRGNGDDLLAIVALESQRARAVIVGEDLGTVEDHVREALAACNVLSYRLVWFEKTPPRRYPEAALAAVTTHDLPTVAGLWSDSDLEVQRELGLAPNEGGTREIKSRVRRMTRAAATTPVTEVIGRLHESLGQAPSRILTATLDDAMAVEERPNMPATSDEWPNWRIALPQPIEQLPKNRLAGRLARALGRRRS